MKIPHWVRGEEGAEMVLPRPKRLAMLGLGSSVGTPPEGTGHGDVETIIRLFHLVEDLKSPCLSSDESVTVSPGFTQTSVMSFNKHYYRALFTSILWPVISE